jgi:hypothetical protein
VCALNGGNTALGQAAFGFSGCTAPSGTVDNTALGANALGNNTEGSGNTATGAQALNSITTGSNNIALGTGAGSTFTNENDNIDIGNPGSSDDAGVIRIGESQSAAYVSGIYNSPLNIASEAHPVYVDPSGRLVADTSVTASVTTGELQILQRTVEEQKATIEQQRAEFELRIVQQQKNLETLTAQLKEQNDQLQRVSVRMEQSRSKLQKVANAK